jgi:RNA polymerase-binding transcription factor DksA
MNFKGRNKKNLFMEKKNNETGKAQSAGAEEKMRYSDEELKEFKELILSKLGEAQSDYELLRSSLTLQDDHGTNDTSPTFKLLEDAADVLSKEETAQLAARQEKFIEHLQNALIRVENKSYGICRITGKLIPKERLRSVPHATMTIDAKRDKPAS